MNEIGMEWPGRGLRKCKAFPQDKKHHELMGGRDIHPSLKWENLLSGKSQVPCISHVLNHSALSDFFPDGSNGKASACNAGDLGSIPGSGRSPEEGNGNPLQHSCLENPMDGGA